MRDRPTIERPLRIGTRGSRLALAQANETRDRIMAAHNLPEAAFTIVVIKTTGDRVTDRPLKDIGGKGLFTKEIEDALLSHDIDVAVHSMKDAPTLRTDGLEIDCLLPRQDPRDAFISPRYASIADLPLGAVVGSSSLRRRAQLAHKRPDLRLIEFRGNVDTRLKKLDNGESDATFLAVAGLIRLNMLHVAQGPIDTEDMLPAVAQGAIGVERRSDDHQIAELLHEINDVSTSIRVGSERAFLARLDGSCQTPIAALAELTADRLLLRGEILRPDGTVVLRGQREGESSDGQQMGVELAEELLSRADPAFFG